MDVAGGLAAPRLQNMLIGRFRVVDFAVAFHDLESIRRTDIQAGAHPVAIYFLGQDGLVLVVKDKSALPCKRSCTDRSRRRARG